MKKNCPRKITSSLAYEKACLLYLKCKTKKKIVEKPDCVNKRNFFTLFCRMGRGGKKCFDLFMFSDDIRANYILLE